MQSHWARIVARVIAIGALLIALPILVSGCAASGDRMIGRAMRAGDWSEAVRLLTAESVRNPDDAKVWARLGEAQYNTGHDAEAEDDLNKALVLDETMYSAHLFLGYVAERQENLDRALWHYQVFVDHKPKTTAARDTQRRIEALKQARAAAFAQKALTDEQHLSPASYPDSSIGVVYFNGERLPDTLRPLAKGLAEMMVTDLSKIPSLMVVERLRVEKLIEEMNLSSTSAFDSTTAPRMGKLLGAAHLLGGDVAGMPQNRVRVDPQIVNARTGEVALPGEHVGGLSGIMGMEKDIVFSVLKKLGIKLTAEQRSELSKVPTDSLAAFLAFSRGLDYQDRGLYDKAEREFSRAVTIDPSFQIASEHATETQYLSGSSPAPPQNLETFAAQTSAQTEWQAEAPSTDLMLGAILNNTAMIRPVGTETTQDDPNTPPTPGAGTVIVNGHFDE